MSRFSLFLAVILWISQAGCGPQQKAEDTKPAQDLENAINETKSLPLITGYYEGKWTSPNGTQFGFGMELRRDVEKRMYEGEGKSGRRYYDFPVAGGELFLIFDDQGGPKIPKNPRDRLKNREYSWLIKWGRYEADTKQLDLLIEPIRGTEGEPERVEALVNGNQISGKFKVYKRLSTFEVQLVEKY